MLFGNDYIDHRTRMNALFHPERVKNVMIEVKRNGGIVKRIESGKKITATDEKYMRLAEKALYSELAIALGISKDKVLEIIMSYH